MARIIAAPTETEVSDGEIGLFLAGGITGCVNWQQSICEQLRNIDRLVVFNPRRENYMDDTAGQIYWEWRHLRSAHAISFWFAAETVQPITLFELGRWTADIATSETAIEAVRGPKRIFVGVDAGYSRRLDIEIQLRYQCPNLEIVRSIPDLVAQITGWIAEQRR